MFDHMHTPHLPPHPPPLTSTQPASGAASLDADAQWEQSILQGMFSGEDAHDDPEIEAQRAWMEVNWLVSQLHKHPPPTCRRLRTCMTCAI